LIIAVDSVSSKSSRHKLVIVGDSSKIATGQAVGLVGADNSMSLKGKGGDIQKNTIGIEPRKQAYVVATEEYKVSDPGAGTLAITTHAHDSNSMASVITRTSEDGTSKLLGIHDGIAIPDSSFDVINVANQVHYENNRDYDMLSSVYNVFARSRAYLEHLAQDSSLSEDDEFKVRAIDILERRHGVSQKGSDLVNSTVGEIESEMNRYMEQVAENSALLYGKAMVSGQFGDPAGNMYSVSAEEANKYAENNKVKGEELYNSLMKFMQKQGYDTKEIEQACKGAN
jgi:hypothetical protein